MARSLPQRLFLFAFMLAMLLKAAVPYGYMPDTRALTDGMMRIRICTSMGAQNILVDKNMKEVDPSQHHDKPRYTGDCVFATGLHFKPDDISPSLVNISFAPLLVSLHARAAAIPVIFNPSAPTRAPPVLS